LEEPSWIADEEERLKEKAASILLTEDEEEIGAEKERVYDQIKSLIDEHDIALLEA